MVSRGYQAHCVSQDHVQTWDTWLLAAHKAHEVCSPVTTRTITASSLSLAVELYYRHIKMLYYAVWCYNLLHLPSLLPATGQSMAPRPSVGVPGPRAMPPYKYATGVRNPNPPVVQPIALQQVRAKDQWDRLVFYSCLTPNLWLIFLTTSFTCPLPGSASCTCSGSGASHSFNAGCCTPSGAETNAG